MGYNLEKRYLVIVQEESLKKTRVNVETHWRSFSAPAYLGICEAENENKAIEYAAQEFELPVSILVAFEVYI